MTSLLGLVLPHVPPDLVAPATVAALTALEPGLPPFRVAGLECRLAADDDRVDIQLGYQAHRGEPQRLARSLRARGETSRAWERVAGLAERWADEADALAAAIAELWLEVDQPSSAALDLPPSVFAKFRSGRADPAAVLRALVDESDLGAVQAVLDKVASAGPERAWISHVGVMLGRSVPGLRLHVSDLPLAAMAGYLGDIGWPGDRDQVVALAAELLAHGDRVIVCIDVVGTLLPSIGLECFFDQQHGVDPRWPPLLARLVDLGLATPAKIGGLLQWPGIHTPPQEQAAWPDELIIADLGRPADGFAVVERRLSHVKLSCGPKATVAKAYFGFGSMRYTDEPAVAPAIPGLHRRPRSRAEAIDAALDRLLAARNQAGLWRDFFDRARPADADRRITGFASDEWVTAYVATMLTTVDDQRARAAAEHALDRLLARRRGELGWGYHALLPPDADTTTWVLRLARALDVADTDQLAAARAFVTALTGPDGATATYRRDAAAPLARFLRMPGDYVGWSEPHACVTAAAGVLALHPRTMPFLLAAQRGDGSWCGHWWDDDEYTTARAVEVLAAAEEGRTAVARAATWAAGRIGPDGAVRPDADIDGSAFATALGLQIVRHGDEGQHEGAARRAARWLIDHQRVDGSWAPSARLRVPGPDAIDPLATPETTRVYVDDEGLFTTATVLAALSTASDA